MCTWKMLIIQRIAFMHLILFVLCTESQSVTLSCALDSEGKGSLFNITKWTRGLSTGENRDKSPSYKDHLQKVAQEAFGKDEIFIKIFGFMARDSVTYYCQVAEKRQRVTNGTTLEVRCSTMETKDAGTDITPVLLVALALIAVLIIFLTFRLMWRNKTLNNSDILITTASGHVQATAQAFPQHGAAQEQLLHYSQLTIKQEGKKSRVKRNVDRLEYASVNSLSMSNPQ